MRGSDRMHALYLHFTDAPLSDYARAENHSAALQITFIFYSAEICMISKSRNSSPDPIELNSGWCEAESWHTWASMAAERAAVPAQAGGREH